MQIPEYLADEILDDAAYLALIFRARWRVLSHVRDDDDMGLFLSNELIGLLRMIVIMTVAGMEALANEELHSVDLYDEHRWKNPEEKWELLYGRAGLKPRKGEDPWQTFKKLLKMRKRLVHYKPDEIQLLPEGPVGSIKLELLGDEGRAVEEQFGAALRVAHGYFTAADKAVEAAAVEKLRTVPHEIIFRTLPWEVPPGAASEDPS